MLPVEIMIDRCVPIANEEQKEVKQLEGIVPPIYTKSKSKEKTTEKSKSDAKVWNHTLDLKHFKPEDIDVNFSNSNRVIVTADKSSNLEENKGIRIVRTVFIPKGVDMCNISSFSTHDGKLVIQAPYNDSKEMGDEDESNCKKCNRKRKAENRATSNDIKKQKTNASDDKTKNQSYNVAIADEELRKTEGLAAGTSSPTDSKLGFDGVKSNMEMNEKCGGNHCHEHNLPSDSKNTHKKTANNNGSKCVHKHTKLGETFGIVNGTSVSYRDIGQIDSVHKQSVILNMPMDNFFPEKNEVTISLAGNTLSIKASRVTKMKQAELSELFVKELSFPSHFDCSSIRLARDIRGWLIISIDRKLS